MPLRTAWKKRSYDLDLGIGIAQGYATLGAIGFEGRWDYACIGSVTNLAARLCSEAKGGQTLTNQKTLSRIEDGGADRASGRGQVEGHRPSDAGVHHHRLQSLSRQRNARFTMGA